MLVNGADGVPPQILGPGQDFMACLIGAAMCGAGLGSFPSGGLRATFE